MTGTCSFEFDSEACEASTEDEPSFDGVWECPHEPFEDARCCLFHLDPERRRELGVDSDEVTDALHSAIRETGAREKQFVGARFGDLDLSYRIVESADNHPVDLRHATVAGTLDLSQSTVRQRIDMRRADVADVEATQAEFQGGCDFGYATFGSVDFEGVSFDDDVDFEGASFEGPSTFDEVRVRGDACFESVRFESSATFRGAGFFGDANVLADDVSFEDATFTDLAKFTKAEFGFAVFRRASFEGDATFEEVRFESDAQFTDATFDRSASFRGAEFRGGANVLFDDAAFDGVTFGERADFELTSFEFANFEGAVFKGDAVFKDGVYGGDAMFTDCSFSGETAFHESRFHGDVSVENVVFDAPVTFSGVEFHGGDNAADDDVSFADTVFEAEATFELAEFRYANFTNASFGADANFASASFEREACFDEASFDGRAVFTEGRFHHDTAFAACTFRAPAVFRGAEFHGGDNVDDDDLTFAGANFQAEADFHRAEFQTASFTEATFGGQAIFDETRFSRDVDFSETAFERLATFRSVWFDDELTFEDAIFDDQAVFTESRFDHDAKFVHVTFDGPVTFRGAEFHGGEHTVDDADFRETTFGEHVDFSLVEFRIASFKNVDVGADFRIPEANFEESAWFDGMTVNGEVDFEHSVFEGTASFSDVTFQGVACFDQIRFEDETTFARAQFAETAYFRSTEFLGDANLHDDDATFEAATFGGDAEFSGARFQYANFTDVVFRASADFTDTRFSETVEFSGAPNGSVGLVEMRRAYLAGGTIEQPDQGSMFYDLTEAVVGDVVLIGNDGRRPLFEHFRFCDTKFENFDFTRHKNALARDNWVVHGWDAPRFEELDSAGAVTDRATLESTYLKAKNSAADFGDRKAAAEFFIKEMTYRRRKNFRVALDRGNGRTASVRNRLNAAGKWFGNGILYQTCGYGERLWRVIYVSVVAIFAWALLYATMTEGTQGASGLRNQGLTQVTDLATAEGLVVFGKNLYFSMVTFTTLGYGDIQPVGMTARTLAGIESFFGALLVALVVFVLGRRVAW